MYEYIKGDVITLTPTFIVIDVNGIGYFINISLQTFTKLEGKTNVKLYVHPIVREDAHLLFGFYNEQEREVFRLLLTVTGIGANTARMMLSSLSADDICSSIMKEDLPRLKSVKGIGLKTAQRIIVELRDKVSRIGIISDITMTSDNVLKEEALSALIALGFSKQSADKVLVKLIKNDTNYTLESLIKDALKLL